MTSLGIQAAQLSSGNPWWRGDVNWYKTDKDLKAAADSGLGYESQVLGNLNEGCLYTLRGPRRVGKTVAVKQAIKALLDSGVKPHRIIRVATDGWSANDLLNLLTNVTKPPIGKGETRYWFIDEVSAISGPWADILKNARDNDEQFSKDTVVITGSNSSRISEGIGILAGRRGTTHVDVERTLLPMGFATFVRLLAPSPVPLITLDPANLWSSQAEKAYNSLIPWLSSLVTLWETYLNYGGFPAATAAAKAGKAIEPSFIKAIFDVIQKDAFRTSQLSTPTSLALQERIWQGLANPFNVSSVAKDIGIKNEAVITHLRYLSDAFLSWECPKLNPGSWLPLQKSQSKIYAIDPLIARLPHLINPHRQDVDPTLLSEMQIGMALRRRLIAGNMLIALDDLVFYFTSTTRKEIDFVSPHLGGVALEGKYVQTGHWKAEAATVEASIWKGILVTRNQLDISGTESWAVPAAILCYLLDT